MVDTMLAYDDLLGLQLSVFVCSSAYGRFTRCCAAAVTTAPFVLMAALFIWIEDRGQSYTHSSAVGGWADHLLFTNFAR